MTTPPENAPAERFTRAVDDFRAWAAAIHADRLSGEWECDYPSWTEIHGAFRALVVTGEVERWPDEVVEAALYAIARDNEVEVLARALPPGALCVMTARALVASEPDARWQLAVALGRARVPEGESWLLRLVDDDDEYVRRRALQSLARIDSSAVEALAVREWARAPEDLPWTRMNALWALHHVGAPAYAALLADARASTNAYLAPYAEKLARGEGDP